MCTELGIDLYFPLLAGFASSSAICLFVAILSHLTSTGSSWAGLVSLSLYLLFQHSSFAPLKWLLLVELSPVFHIPWSIALGSAAVWTVSLSLVMVFPVLMSYQHISLSVLSWTGAVTASLCYVVTLWLLPDLRKAVLGEMELHFLQVFKGDKRLKTFQTSDEES